MAISTGASDFLASDREMGLTWLRRIADRFPRSVRLDPEPIRGCPEDCNGSDCDCCQRRGRPGCAGNPDVEACVCAALPSCCTAGWSTRCAGVARDDCGGC